MDEDHPGPDRSRSGQAGFGQTKLGRHSALAFPVALADGKTVAEVGDAADLFEALSEDQRRSSHWSIAIRMLDHALIEPAYLKTATLSLQTALAMDGLLDHMN
jgi:hypothetical protein